MVQVVKSNLKIVLGLLVGGLMGLSAPSLRADQPASPLPPLDLTLSRAIEVALKENRDVLASREDVTKSVAQIREAYSLAMPQVDVSSSYVRNLIPTVMYFNNMSIQTTLDNSYSVGASLAQPLWSRKVGIALEIAETYHEFFERGMQATEEATIRNVTKAYYQALLTKKLVDVTREGLTVVTANRNNIKAAYEVGAAAEFDLLRAEVELANTEPAVTSAENNYQISKDALKNLLAIPLEQEVNLQGDLEFADVSTSDVLTANSKATESNIGLVQLRLQESLLTKNVEIERAGYYPSVYLVGSYRWQTQDNTFDIGHYRWQDSFSLGVSLSFTAFDGFRTASKIQQASADQRKIHITRIKAEEGLQLQIQAAANRMIEAKKRINAQAKSLEQAKKALKIAQTRFSSGISIQLELMDAQVALTRTQTMHAQAIYDFLTAKADWEYAVGTIR